MDRLTRSRFLRRLVSIPYLRARLSALRILRARGEWALLRVHELSANISSLASVSEHSHLAVLMSADSMPSQLRQCQRPLQASRFRCMMLAAQFKQRALMPLAVSPLFSALVGSSDLVHLGACGKLSLENSKGISD